MLTIIGLGNQLRGDDGIGPCVIRRLESYGQSYPLRLIDAGADAFTVLHHLIEDGHVVLIDAASMGKEPGTVSKIVLNENTLTSADINISMHGFGFKEIFAMARELNPAIHCTVIGVEPKSVKMNSGLSAEVEERIPQIMEFVIEELQTYVKKENTDH